MAEVDAAREGGSLHDSDRSDEVLRVARCVAVTPPPPSFLFPESPLTCAAGAMAPLRPRSALLEITPGDESALDLMLQPPTLNGLAHVSGIGASFPEHTWTHYLLPFLRDQLGVMSVAVRQPAPAAHEAAVGGGGTLTPSLPRPAAGSERGAAGAGSGLPHPRVQPCVLLGRRKASLG